MKLWNGFAPRTGFLYILRRTVLGKTQTRKLSQYVFFVTFFTVNFSAVPVCVCVFIIQQDKLLVNRKKGEKQCCEALEQ